MANIIILLREEVSQSLLENGTAGVGAIQTRELGYTEEKQEFSYKTMAGAFRHVPTREKLSLAAAAATSGAKIVGYFPASGLSSVTVQDALDELRGQVAAGGGGTVLGTGTAGKLIKWATSTIATDSILSESSSKILFNGDSVANLYRFGAGLLLTDGSFNALTDIVALRDLSAGRDLGVSRNFAVSGLADLSAIVAFSTDATDSAMTKITGLLVKNDPNTRVFHSLKIKPEINAGGSNANTTFNLLTLDTINTNVTGVTVNLLKMSYGGTEVFKLASNGAIKLTEPTDAANKYADLSFVSSALSLVSNRALTFRAKNDYQMTFDIQGAGRFNFQKSTWELMSLGGSGSGATDNYLEFGNQSGTNFYLKINTCDAGKEPAILNSAEVNVFMKNNCIAFQYSDGGTTRYKYLDLSGTGVTWVHSTTSP